MPYGHPSSTGHGRRATAYRWSPSVIPPSSRHARRSRRRSSVSAAQEPPAGATRRVQRRTRRTQRRPAVRTVTVANGTNLALFAARDETTLDKLPRLAEKLQDRELSSLMRHVAANWQSPARGGEPLTDDKAPVELLGMKALDGIIRKELQYYKEIYRREGFDGLQKALM